MERSWLDRPEPEPEPWVRPWASPCLAYHLGEFLRLTLSCRGSIVTPLMRVISKALQEGRMRDDSDPRRTQSFVLKEGENWNTHVHMLV